MNITNLPKPELRGVGKVMYKCRACKELMEPSESVIVDGHSWHPEHAPKENEEWQLTQD